MKAFCSFCGCHFPQDFEKTLIAPCNFWGDHGMSNFSVEVKKEFWDWLFSMPVDKMHILYGVDLPVSFKAVPIAQGNKFEDIVLNWAELSEEDKQTFQRNWFKDRSLGLPLPPLPLHYLGDKK